MAKSEAAGRYRPNPLPAVPDVSALARYVQNETQRIGDAIDFGHARSIEFLHVPPQKPFEGLTVGADGTNWNPGAGKGVYTYYSGTWNKLG